MTKDLKVHHIQNGIEHLYPIQDIEQGKKLITALAESDLHNEAIEFNAFGIVEWDNEENDYFEWYDENGRDIMEILDEEEDN